jgi:hypothetical protein
MALLDLPKPSYFLPTAKPRLKPRLGGKIGPQGISAPKITPRILPTSISGITGRIRIPKAGALSGGKAQVPKLKTLLTQTHTGRPPASNPTSGAKPPSASQTSGFSQKLPSVRLQGSAVSKPPGIHSIAGAKMAVRQTNPFKIHTPRPFRIKGL